jgi:hypothetical protein
MEAFGKNDFPSPVAVPDIHTTKLPDGIIFRKAAIGASLNMSRTPSNITIPLA